MVNAFTSEEKKLIVDYIESKPIKVVEAIDTDKKTVTYSKDLKGKTITTLPGDEEITRAYILTRLVNELGYSIENIELEHEYTAGRPHTNTSIIDINVRDENNDAFLFIEVKSPEECASIDKDKTIEEQLFKVAGMERTEGHKVKYLMLYTLDINGRDITDDCMIIDSDDFSVFSDWEATRDYLTEIPEGYGVAKKVPYVKGSKKDLITNFSHELLDYIQEDLHNVLWGGGGTDDNDVFSSLTNLILAKIEDEEEKGNGDTYDFQTLSFETPEALYNRINALYRRALKEKLNITDDDQIEKSHVVDTNKFSIDAIFCDFLIRIKIDEKVVNPLFAYYYFRTDYFQYLVEINKKGLGNNTNIFPNNLQDFPFPDLSLTEQEKIVNQVKAKMHEQDSIKAEIKNKKEIIEDKIEAAMKKFQNR